ncbi:MAG TPA: flagellar export chaperone FlgN [Gemmatimonadales bacterium]|nr:flagellar export chaperone FlgN [Gemmatimonadales bacterium]
MLSLLTEAPVSPTDPRLDELRAALERELHLIEHLRQALLRQRAGVAADDAEAIDASVQAVGRTLLTLDEARRHRAAIVGSVLGSEDASLADLEQQVGGALPASLVAAREAVRRAADAAAREIAINQQVLRRALEAGDAFLQQLFASAADPMPVYSPSARAAEPRSSGLLLNRTA